MPEIKLEVVQREVIEIEVDGASPLIPHKWSEKSLRMMREAQSGKAVRSKHGAKIPEDEAEAALYRLPDGRPAMPATAFKASMVGAARLFAGVTMTALKAAIFVHGEGPDQLVPIEGEMTLREDTPRNATGVVDLRYRYSFWPWKATLRVEYLSAMVDKDSIVALVDAAGNGGVGDWRPSAPKSLTGTFGRFRVAAL
jgi:hypothetical protein